MSRPTIYQQNYVRLLCVLGDLSLIKPFVAYHYTALPYMDLSVERVGDNEISICHYFRQNGDLCQDPEMLLRVKTSQRTVEALFFQQAIPPIFLEVYPSPGMVNLQQKRNQNRFLADWLDNLSAQGHTLRGKLACQRCPRFFEADDDPPHAPLCPHCRPMPSKENLPCPRSTTSSTA